MRISDWSSDVCSSDLAIALVGLAFGDQRLLRDVHRVVVRAAGLAACIGEDAVGDLVEGDRHQHPRARAGGPLGGAVGGDETLLQQVVLGRRIQLDRAAGAVVVRSEEHTSELQSLMRISYAVFCLKTKKQILHKRTMLE